ncbi:MAG: XRE family transcriptional regulator [Mesorhizobium sp.]|nr:XRE family transcriptional regulator [Mesorhizobium sp.]
MSEDIEFVHGSGNVFSDLGDTDAEAKQMKAKVAAEIIGVLNRRSLTVRQAAREARCDPADIQRIRNADLSRFTLDRLVRIAARLGQRFELRTLGGEAA